MKFLLLLFTFTFISLANDVEIIDVKATRLSDSTYTFWVTLKHKDSSWEHYADSYSVLDENKKLIKKRVLWHPHEHEQPFTRSLFGVKIDPSSKFVYIRAHAKIHGYAKKLYKYNLVK